MSDWLGWGALALAGAVASAINVIAGGGSFLTLPLLIFLGLPPTVANATNRVGVFFQSASAVYGFERRGLIDWRSAAWAGVPAALGAVLGTLLALAVSDAAFRRILALLMVAVTLWTLLAPRPRGPREAAGGWRRLGIGAAFVLVGVYGGFVQAGVGFFILAATTWAGLDLVRGNAVKVLCVGVLTALSLAIFAWSGKVDWASGLALAAGSVVGSEIGVRLAVGRSERWVRGVVTLTVVLFAVKLWFE